VAECVDLADFCEGRSDELSIASPPRPFLLRTPFVKEVVSVFRHVTSMEAVYRLAVMVLVCGKWIGWMVAWLLGSPSLCLVPGAWCLVGFRSAVGCCYQHATGEPFPSSDFGDMPYRFT
jgi:hypothetical protein